MPTRTILLVEDDVESRNRLSAALAAEGYTIVTAVDGIEGLRAIERELPDVVLVDVSLPRLDGFEVVSRIRGGEGAASRTPIIMLSDVDQADQRVRGLRAGADDFLVKPVHPTELAMRLRVLLGRAGPRGGAPPSAEATRAEPDRRGTVIAFYGAKGGVGTTTLTASVAVGLVRTLARKVALVDGNLQFGDLRVVFDLRLDTRTLVDVAAAPSIDLELLHSILVRHDSGVDVLAAPASPEAAEAVSQEARHVARVLEVLRAGYDYVVVDIDKRLDETNLDVIGAADLLYIIMTADLSCLKNVGLVLHTLAQLDVPADKIRLVLNRSTAYTGISAKNAESVLGRKIDHEVVNDYRRAIHALNTGSPVLWSSPDSQLGKSILALVREVDAAAREQAEARRDSAGLA
jgi:pilus assembly protein CpaE